MWNDEFEIEYWINKNKCSCLQSILLVLVLTSIFTDVDIYNIGTHLDAVFSC